MKRLFAGLAVVAVAATLSGCYYDPGYSYVRGSGYAGDAYYGRAAPVYQGGYYAAPGYYDGYYGYGYGCCYASGVSVGYYGGSRYNYYRGGGYRGRGDHDDHGYHGHDYGHGGNGHWQGHTAPAGHARPAPVVRGGSHGSRGGDRYEHH
jgi:hypothetical protein